MKDAVLRRWIDICSATSADIASGLKLRRALEAAELDDSSPLQVLPSSQLGILQGIRAAFQAWRTGNLVREPSGNIRKGWNVIVESRLAGEPTPGAEESVFDQPRNFMPMEREMVTPTFLEEHYGLAGGPPALAEFGTEEWTFARLALRIISCILVYGVHRCRSILRIEIRHILVSRSFVEIVIPDSKGGNLDLRVPLWGLMPDAELQFFRDFAEFCRRGKIASSKRLTEMAWGKRYLTSQTKLLQSDYRAALKSHGVPHSKSLGTHLPRTAGVSWIGPRVAAAHDLALLSDPALADVRDHILFSPRELAKLLRLFPAESTDVIETIRRVGGWKGTHEVVHRYFRGVFRLLASHLAQHRRRHGQPDLSV